MVRSVSPLLLVAVWFALSVPAAIGVGTALSGDRRHAGRPARRGQPQPVALLTRR